MTLKDWEIQTIEALAAEALEKLSSKEYVRQPERFVETFIADLQRDALAGKNVRASLAQQAQRLGVGLKHPSRRSADDPLGYTPVPCPPVILAHITAQLRRVGAMPTREQRVVRDATLAGPVAIVPAPTPTLAETLARRKHGAA